MATANAPVGSKDALNEIVQTTSALISQFEPVLHAAATDKTSSVTTPPSSSSTPQSQTIDALSLAHDSASLIKAHSTKISLLIINEPFTPSALVKVLKELVASPIPGIASAVQACDIDRYTTVVRQDLAWKCYRVLKELKTLIEVIPLDGKVPAPEKKKGISGGMGSMTVTGVIWAACDDVILLKKLGIAGLLVKKVEQYRDTLKDVLDELKEWKKEGEEAGDEEEDEVEYVAHQLDATNLSVQDTQDALDDLMSTRHIPRDDPDKLGERLDSCLKRLRLTTLLYSAVVKRRLKTLPLLPAEPGSPTVRRLDEVFPILRGLPNRFNELACAFYELEPGPVDDAMDACFFDAFAASEMLMKSWAGQKDEFTEWAEKYQVSMKKPDETEG
ncbi:hypothetical protein PG994_002721 [Apiospora phragmitis]|uniref:Cyclin-D1-binding protein 1-like N-terminal domain-containing protein n=1 Tax=Apiospora phragmitis TaxID=2905665 RepID=A0ABR1W5Y9_9PEZI